MGKERTIYLRIEYSYSLPLRSMLPANNNLTDF